MAIKCCCKCSEMRVLYDLANSDSDMRIFHCVGARGIEYNENGERVDLEDLKKVHADVEVKDGDLVILDTTSLTSANLAAKIENLVLRVQHHFIEPEQGGACKVICQLSPWKPF